MARKVFAKNEVIFRENQPGNTMFLIDYGMVGVYSDYNGPTQVELTKLYEGEFFGEMSLLAGEKRSATVVALDNTEVEEITKDDFVEFATDNPMMLDLILSHAAQRLRALTSDYEDACATINEFYKVKERGEKVSVDLAKRLKKYVQK